MDEREISEKNIFYKCSEQLHYVVEYSSIILVDTRRGHTLTLEYPEAAIWDFLCRGYELSRINRLLTYICHITATHADSIIKDFLSLLIENDFLVIRVNNG